MIKVLFVCLGNICRSPMAEYVFKDMVKKKNLENEFYIDSVATSSEETGNGIHQGTKNKLAKMNILCGNHKARQITKEDYKKFDYIIGMEETNILNIKKIVGEDFENKVSKLLDFTENPRDIADPWYTGNFDKTYDDIVEGLEAFWNAILKKYNLVNGMLINKEIYEKCLPTYLERDLINLKNGIKDNVSYIDCLINELQGSVNSAFVDGDITEAQCDYLYERYIRMEIN